MTEDDVRKTVFAMPLTSPAFPMGDPRPHALAEQPLLDIAGAVHMTADLTLDLGTVVHDYLAK